MEVKSKWCLTDKEQEKYIDALTPLLPDLRAKAKIPQSELAKAIGVSRQTYSSIEGKRRKMTWNTFLSLSLFFDYNNATRQMFRESGAFCKELMDGVDYSAFDGIDFGRIFGSEAESVLTMLKALDSQGLHSLKTMLWIEYARCTKQSGEAILKSFDGENLNVDQSENYRKAQKALRNIQQKYNG